MRPNGIRPAGWFPGGAYGIRIRIASSDRGRRLGLRAHFVCKFKFADRVRVVDVRRFGDKMVAISSPIAGREPPLSVSKKALSRHLRVPKSIGKRLNAAVLDFEKWPGIESHEQATV